MQSGDAKLNANILSQAQMLCSSLQILRKSSKMVVFSKFDSPCCLNRVYKIIFAPLRKNLLVPNLNEFLPSEIGLEHSIAKWEN